MARGLTALGVDRVPARVVAHAGPVGDLCGGWFATLLRFALGCAAQTTQGAIFLGRFTSDMQAQNNRVEAPPAARQSRFRGRCLSNLLMQ